MTLYRDLVDAGVPVDHHESDLWFPVSVRSTAILRQYPAQANSATTFDPATRELRGLPGVTVEAVRWYDVPFAYDPYWEGSQARPREGRKGKR